MEIFPVDNVFEIVSRVKNLQVSEWRGYFDGNQHSITINTMRNLGVLWMSSTLFNHILRCIEIALFFY